MNTQTQSLEKTKSRLVTASTAEREVAFVPFGAADEIRLSIKIIQNIVAVPTKSGATCSERDAMRFLMMCQAQRLNPFANDAYLTGYDSKDGPKFSLITAVQVFYKRAETCPDYEGIESGIILLNEDGSTSEREGDFCLPDEEVVGGWAIVSRKGRKPMKAKLSIEAMKPPYETPFWGKAKAPGQICKCAEMDALRRSFPSLLGGLYIQGEMDASAMQVASRVVTTKPIFEAPQRQIAPPANSHNPDANESHIGTGAAGATPFSDDGEGTDLGPQTSTQPEQRAPESAPAGSVKPDHLKALLPLMKSFKVSEAQLLDYLRTTGKADESLSSLDEINMVAPAAIDHVYENWQSIVTLIKKEKK